MGRWCLGRFYGCPLCGNPTKERPHGRFSSDRRAPSFGCFLRAGFWRRGEAQGCVSSGKRARTFAAAFAASCAKHSGAEPPRMLRGVEGGRSSLDPCRPRSHWTPPLAPIRFASTLFFSMGEVWRSLRRSLGRLCLGTFYSQPLRGNPSAKNCPRGCPLPKWGPEGPLPKRGARRLPPGDPFPKRGPSDCARV